MCWTDGERYCVGRIGGESGIKDCSGGNADGGVPTSVLAGDGKVVTLGACYEQNAGIYTLVSIIQSSCSYSTHTGKPTSQ